MIPEFVVNSIHCFNLKMFTEPSQETEKEVKISIERIIEIVREVRNGLINDFLRTDSLKVYFKEQYNKELSQVKEEFLKRDLKSLADSSVDLSHYALLIKQMQEQTSASLTVQNQELFYRELETIFKKYNY